MLWMAEVCNHLLSMLCSCVTSSRQSRESPLQDSQPVAMDTDTRLIPCLLSAYLHEQAQGVSSGHGKGDQSEDTALPLTGSRPPSWPSTEQEEGMPISLWLHTMAGCIVFLQGALGGLLRSLVQVSDFTHACIHSGLKCGCELSPFSCKMLLL